MRTQDERAARERGRELARDAYGAHAQTFSSGRAVIRTQRGPGLHRDVEMPRCDMVYWSERYGMFRRWETNELITRRRP